MTFAELGLHETIQNALTTAGYQAPTPVQAQAIPAALAGRDLLVSSQTGSGKTAAFTLPALHRLALQERPPRPAAPQRADRRESVRGKAPRPRPMPAQPRVLVLTPTRELALQVTGAVEKYGHHIRHLKSVAILGGTPYPKQLEMLAHNPEILVATPGRLIDHLQSGRIDLSSLQILVLDEADRMLDMGFIEDIENIVACTPDTRQTLLFSATLDGPVERVARAITRDPQRIAIALADNRRSHIAQRLHYVDDFAHKNRLLDHLLRDASIDQAVIFTATKREADTLSDRLNLAGFSAAPLHGDLHQGARNRTLNALRRGQIRVLVATDVAARGIDVPSITHVFNYDLPKFAEDYVHRIGRTGRAGREGIAISLANHAERFNVQRIERFTQQPIPVETVPGHEPTRQAPKHRPQPSRHGKANRSAPPARGTPSRSTPGARPAHAPGNKKGYGAKRPRTGTGT